MHDQIIRKIIDTKTWTGSLTFGEHMELLLDGKPLFTEIYGLLRFATDLGPLQITLTTHLGENNS